MPRDEPLDLHRLRRENDELRAAVDRLLDELESAQGVSIDADHVREILPPARGERDPITPPWTREGYESKDAWLADRGSGGGSR